MATVPQQRTLKTAGEDVWRTRVEKIVTWKEATAKG